MYCAISPQTGTRGERIEQRQHGLPDGAADILEVDIDALRACRRELFGKVRRPMVDGRVEAQLLGDVTALVRPAGNADRAGAADLGELSDQRTDWTARRRDDHRLARFGLADEQQA